MKRVAAKFTQALKAKALSGAVACVLWAPASPANAALTIELEIGQITEPYTVGQMEDKLNPFGAVYTSGSYENTKFKIDEIKSAANALRTGIDRFHPTLVLSVGDLSGSAIIFFYTENQSKSWELKYKLKKEEDYDDALGWTKKLTNRQFASEHFGSVKQFQNITDVSEPLLSVKIPLTATGVIDTLLKFREIAKSNKSLKSDLTTLLNGVLDDHAMAVTTNATDQRTALEWLYERLLRLHPLLRSDCLPLPQARNDTSVNRSFLALSWLVGRMGKKMRDFYNEAGSDFFELRLANYTDPAVLPVLDCQVKRDILFGENHKVGNIVLRSQYHRIASEMLRNLRGNDSPQFFYAFHVVTSALVGTGYVDIPSFLHDSWISDLSAASFFVEPPKRKILCKPDSPDEKDLIIDCDAVRETNEVLFEHNRQVIRRLVKMKPGVWFDPLGKGKRITSSKEFDFRMVLMEQSLVEDRLSGLDMAAKKSITEVAKETLGLIPKYGLRHNQWVGCKAGKLVSSLEAEESRKFFYIFRDDDGGYVFDPQFENYWWRVAIGVAYVLVLHEKDPFKQSCEVEYAEEYSKILRKLLEEAPKKSLDGDLQSVVDELVDVHGLSKEFKANQTQLLGGTLVKLKDWEAVDWQGCNNRTLEITRSAYKKGESEWRDVLKALMHEAHALTLADVFESSGGANGDTLLDKFTHDDVAHVDACDAVEARKKNTWCLLGAKTDCDLQKTGVFAGSGDDHLTLLDFQSDDAAALRSQLPAIWPFLHASISEAIAANAIDGAADPVAVAKRAIESRSNWERDLKQAGILARTDAESLEALGLDNPDLFRGRGYGELFEEAIGAEVDELVAKIEKNHAENEDAWQEVDEALEPSASLKRVADSENWRKRMRVRISELQKAYPIPYDSPPLGVGRAARLASSTSGRGTDKAKPGVEFDLLLEGGQAPDGRPKHRAVGMYKVPAELGDGTPRTPQPIGLEVLDVLLEPDGTLLALFDGRNNITQDENAARALLSSFGLPELFQDASVRYELRQDFESLTMHIAPKLMSIELEEFDVVLLDGGLKRQDIDQQLFDGLKISLKETANKTIYGLLEPVSFKAEFETMTIIFASCPEHGEDDDNGVVKLDGIHPSREGVPPPLRVVLKPKFCLTLMIADQKTLKVLARPEIALDSSGLHIENIEIKSDALLKIEEKINVEIKKIVCKNTEDENCVLNKFKVTIELTTGTETVGKRHRHPASHGLGIGVNAVIALPSPLEKNKTCFIPFRNHEALADLKEIFRNFANWLNEKQKEIEEELKEGLLKGFQCAANVVVEEAFDSVAKWIDAHSQGIDILGVNWRLDCGEVGDINCAVIDISANEARIGVVVNFDRSCNDEEPEEFKVRNLAVQINEKNKIHFSLEYLQDEDRQSLAEALVAQVCAVVQATPLRGLIGPKPKLRFENPEVGENEGVLYFYSKITIYDVPYFGDVSLGRISLTDIGAEDIKSIVINFLTAQFSKSIVGTINFPYVGKFTLGDESVSFEQSAGDDDAVSKFKIKGELEFGEFPALELTLTLGVPGLEPGFELDKGSSLAAINGMLATIKKKIPFGGNKFDIDVRDFGEFPPGSGRYAVVLDASVDFTLLEIDVEGLAIGIDGIRMPGSIKGSWDQEIPLGGAVAIDEVGFTYYTGRANSGRKGLVIEGDIVPVDGFVGKVAKLEAQLDLSDIDELRLEVTGDLIVLGTTPLLSAYGEVAVLDANFLLDARTPGWLEKILDTRASVWIGIDPDKRIESDTVGIQSNLTVLSVELAKVEARVDMPSEGSEGSIKLNAGADLLLGSAELDFESEPDFSGPEFVGKVGVGLFGWDAIEAKLKADSEIASASLEVFLVRLNVSAPSMDRLGKQNVYKALKGQFGMPLADMAGLDPGDSAGRSIRKVTKQKDGSTEVTEVTSHSSTDPADGVNGAMNPDNPPKTALVKTETEASRPGTAMSERGAREAEVDETTTEASLVASAYCRRLKGNQNRFVRVVGDQSPNGNSSSDLAFDRPTHGFRLELGPNPLPPCVGGGGRNSGESDLVWASEWVPLTSRGPWSFNGCDVSVARPWLGVTSRDGTMPEPGEASPVRATLACWGNGTTAIADFFQNTESGELAVLIQCPVGTVPEGIAELDEYVEVCGEDASSFKHLPLGQEGASWFEPSYKNVVGPETAYRAFEMARAAAFGRNPVEPTTIDVGIYKATLYADADELTVLMVESDGGAILGVGQIEDERVRKRIIKNAEGDRMDEGTWTQALLGPWLENVDRASGKKHPNRMRPRIVGVVEDILAWTLADGAGNLEIGEDIIWSWPEPEDGRTVETRRIELVADQQVLQGRKDLIAELARELPKVEHKDRTLVILERHDDGYKLEFLALLSDRSEDEDVRILFAPTEAAGIVGNLCGLENELEEFVVEAHRKTAGETAEFELRKWLRNPEGTSRKLAHDPLSVLLIDAESECK